MMLFLASIGGAQHGSQTLNKFLINTGASCSIGLVRLFEFTTFALFVAIVVVMIRTYGFKKHDWMQPLTIKQWYVFIVSTLILVSILVIYGYG